MVVGREGLVCCSANGSDYEQEKDTALGKKGLCTYHNQEGMRLQKKNLFLAFI